MTVSKKKLGTSKNKGNEKHFKNTLFSLSQILFVHYTLHPPNYISVWEMSQVFLFCVGFYHSFLTGVNFFLSFLCTRHSEETQQKSWKVYLTT